MGVGCSEGLLLEAMNVFEVLALAYIAAKVRMNGHAAE